MSPRAILPLALVCCLGDILLLLLQIKALTTTLTALYAHCTPRNKAEELQATLMYYNSLVLGCDRETLSPHKAKARMYFVHVRRSLSCTDRFISSQGISPYVLCTRETVPRFISSQGRSPYALCTRETGK